jgi:glycosyltransferase involved in cell wall biosynthesis
MVEILNTAGCVESLLRPIKSIEGGLRTQNYSKTNAGTKPRISVITVVLNGEKYLEQTIQSVIKQTYVNLEYLVVDGGSTDGSLEILRKYEHSIDYWVSECDGGIYSAMNKGVALSTGDWLIFINADDFLWSPFILEQIGAQLAVLSAQTLVAYGKIMLLDSEGKAFFTVGEPWVKVKKRFEQAMVIPHPGVMHRRTLFNVHGLFDESYKIAGDYELLLRELKNADAHYIEGIIVTGMRHGGISNRPEESLSSLKETRRAQIKHGKKFPGAIWLMSLMRVYLRKLFWHFLGERLTRSLLDLGRRVMGLKAVWTEGKGRS